MSDHEHHDHDHDHDHGQPATAPVTAEDTGSQALATALQSSFAIVRWVMVLLVVLFVCSGIFSVGPQERVVILRFGKPVGDGNKALLGPGFHWSYPPPIDEQVRIPITRIQKVTSTTGWYFTTPETEFNNQEPQPSQPLNPASDGYAMTADGYIIHARATVNYHVEDPIRFQFDFVNASNALQSAVDEAVLYASSHYKVDDALTRDKLGLQELILKRVTDLAQREQLGIAIDQCQVETKPPMRLKADFESVTTALSKRDTTHNEALKDQTEKINGAKAQASSRINAAKGERVTLVAAVKAEADQFNALLPKWESDPALFGLLLTERIGETLTNVQDKVFMPDRADGQPWEVRLQISREPLVPVSATSKP